MDNKKQTFQEIVKDILCGGNDTKSVSDVDATSITRLARLEEGLTFVRFLRQEGEWARQSAVITMGDERWNSFHQGKEAAYNELADKLETLRNV